MSRDVNRQDLSQYTLKITPSQLTQSMRFHVGEPIEIAWSAPATHSRTDWVGIYPVGMNTSRDVTQVASAHLWLGVYAEEWQGDVPRNEGDASQHGASGKAEGVLKFALDKVPMTPGQYEVCGRR